MEKSEKIEAIDFINWLQVNLPNIKCQTLSHRCSSTPIGYLSNEEGVLYITIWQGTPGYHEAFVYVLWFYLSSIEREIIFDEFRINRDKTELNVEYVNLKLKYLNVDGIKNDKQLDELMKFSGLPLIIEKNYNDHEITQILARDFYLYFFLREKSEFNYFTELYNKSPVLYSNYLKHSKTIELFNRIIEGYFKEYSLKQLNYESPALSYQRRGSTGREEINLLKFFKSLKPNKRDSSNKNIDIEDSENW